MHALLWTLMNPRYLNKFIHLKEFRDELTAYLDKIFCSSIEEEERKLIYQNNNKDIEEHGKGNLISYGLQETPTGIRTRQAGRHQRWFCFTL